MKVLIVPGNVQNAKSYPFWTQLYILLKDHEIREVKGILTEKEIIEQIKWCDVWISIDSFIQHLVAYHKLKRGIVLWGTSYPDIFGYSTNLNLLKDRGYLRPNPFLWWKAEAWNPEAFVAPEVVVEAIKSMVQ